MIQKYVGRCEQYSGKSKYSVLARASDICQGVMGRGGKAFENQVENLERTTEGMARFPLVLLKEECESHVIKEGGLGQ